VRLVDWNDLSRYQRARVRLMTWGYLVPMEWVAMALSHVGHGHGGIL
jgi:hypothetical protein